MATLLILSHGRAAVCTQKVCTVFLDLAHSPRSGLNRFSLSLQTPLPKTDTFTYKYLCKIGDNTIRPFSVPCYLCFAKKYLDNNLPWENISTN